RNRRGWRAAFPHCRNRHRHSRKTSWRPCAGRPRAGLRCWPYASFGPSPEARIGIPRNAGRFRSGNAVAGLGVVLGQGSPKGATFLPKETIMAHPATKKRGGNPNVKHTPDREKPDDAMERKLEQGLEESMAGSDPVSI